jgi:hypothetical protein
MIAINDGTITLSAVSPYYAYGFGLSLTTAAWFVTSSSSVYEYAFEDQGQTDMHYLSYSGNEMDHNAGYPYAVGDLPGYKAKHLLMIWRPPYIVGWPTGLSTGQNGGSMYSVQMCLFVDDSVLIPVNASTDQVNGHQVNNPDNPFKQYGFDVGSTCMTPEVSGGGAKLAFATEDYKASGELWVILANLHKGSKTGEKINCLQYDGNTHRYPCGPGTDGVTNFFLGKLATWAHNIAYPYPVCAWGFRGAIGGNSAIANIGNKFTTILPGKEYIFCGFPANYISPDLTSGYTVAWF